MNYKELKQLAYDCELGKNFLFDSMNLERNVSYEKEFLLKAIKTHMKRYSDYSKTQNKGIVKKLNMMIEKLTPQKNEPKNKATPKDEKDSLFTIREISKKFELSISETYRIFKDYPRCTIIPCTRRPDGQKAYNGHQIKDAFEIAIYKNLIPSKIDQIKKIYELLPDFSNLGIYPLTNKQLRDVAQKMDFPQITIKQPETVIELQKETNNLLRQLLEIWRK